jgi:hypothetical protein
MESALTTAWIWSAVLVVVTIGVHVSGIALVALLVPRFWAEDVSGRQTFFDTIPGSVSAMTAIAVVLVVFHVVEASIWAVAYAWLGVVHPFAHAMLYSIGSMSTAGSGLSVAVSWRSMGAIESLDAWLIFGISTAFLFSLMRFLWRSVLLRHTNRNAASR